MAAIVVVVIPPAAADGLRQPPTASDSLRQPPTASNSPRQPPTASDGRPPRAATLRVGRRWFGGRRSIMTPGGAITHEALAFQAPLWLTWWNALRCPNQLPSSEVEQIASNLIFSLFFLSTTTRGPNLANRVKTPSDLTQPSERKEPTQTTQTTTTCFVLAAGIEFQANSDRPGERQVAVGPTGGFKFH